MLMQAYHAILNVHAMPITGLGEQDKFGSRIIQLEDESTRITNAKANIGDMYIVHADGHATVMNKTLFDSIYTKQDSVICSSPEGVKVVIEDIVEPVKKPKKNILGRPKKAK
jgi:hypothetical protein